MQVSVTGELAILVLPDEIRSLQTECLESTLQRVYRNSPVYRQKFDNHGVRPEDLRCLGDLSHFPFTTEADLRNNYPFGLFCVPMEQVVRIHASNGTTAIEEQILSVAGLSPHYLIEVHKSGYLDVVTLSVERRGDASQNTGCLRTELERKIKSMLGISAKVRISNVGELPRSEGKAIRVVDRRGIDS